MCENIRVPPPPPLGPVQSNGGNNVSLDLRSTHYPLIKQDIMQKVDLKKKRQPTGFKMVNGIVSANHFHIFSESNDYFSFKMRFNLV